MKSILVNGKRVKVSIETFHRIGKIATAEKIPFDKAVELCLENTTTNGKRGKV